MANKANSVSVLLPVYNGASFVQDAIDSIIGQSFSDWELIICDDGSNDNSREICQEATRKNKKIRFIANEKNYGIAKTMNRLVSLAQGTYLAIQEQDDISLPHRLEVEVKILKEDKSVGLVSGIAARINDSGDITSFGPGILTSGRQYPQTYWEMVTGLYTEQYQVVNSACMFRKSLIKEFHIAFDEQAITSVDWEFFIDLAHVTKFWGLHDVLIKMRRGENHISLTSNKSLVFAQARRSINVLYEKYNSNPLSPINESVRFLAFEKQLKDELEWDN